MSDAPTPAALTLRRATSEDARLLSALNREVQELHAAEAPDLFKPWRDEEGALEFFRGLLSQTRNHVELALQADVVAGYAWWSVEQRPESTFRHALKRLYVHHIAVATGARRRGVGRALLQAAVARAHELGAAGVVLDTWSFNTDAQAFFRAQGFEVARLELVRRLP